MCTLMVSTQAIDWGRVCLAPSYGLHTPSFSEQWFSKNVYTYGWYSARPQKLIRKQIKSIFKFNYHVMV
jgi:hypothetical protein